MKAILRTWYVVAFTCCMQAATKVGAQENANDAEAERAQEARRLHRAAVDDFARGAYLQAVQGFIAADRLTPRAGFLFNIAKSYDALHDAAHALAAYRGYLREAESAPDATQVARRVSDLSLQRGGDGVEQVSVLSQPLGAQLFVDDEPMGPTPITVDLTLGRHTISLSLGGYRTLDSTVIAESSQPRDVSFSLVAIEAGGSSPACPTPAAHALARSAPARVKPNAVATDFLQIGGIASLGAGVVALGAGIAFEVLRAGSERSARREDVQTRFAHDLETIHAQQTLARVFAGSGVALAAVGGVLLGLSRASSERKPAPAGVSIACMPSHCQGVWSGVF